MEIKKRFTNFGETKYATDVKHSEKKKDLLSKRNNKFFQSSPDLSLPPCDQMTELASETKFKNDIIIKNRKAEDDINEDLFTSRFRPEKRTDTEEKMREERFKLNLFAINQAGFITKRPLFWLLALEIYEEQYDDVNSTWYYKKDKHGKYIECEIMMVFKRTSKITLIVSILTGVFIVKGKMYKKWIYNDFPRVKNIMDTDLNEITETDKPRNNSVSLPLDVDRSLLRQEEERNLNELKASIDSYIEEKLTIFSNTLEKNAQTEIKKIENAFNEKLVNLKKEIKNLKSQNKKMKNNQLTCKEEAAATKDKIMLDMPSPEYLNDIISMSGNIKEYCKEINSLIKKNKSKEIRSKMVNGDTKTKAIVKEESENGESKKESYVLEKGDTPSYISPMQLEYIKSNDKRKISNAQNAVDLLVCMDLNRTHVNWRNFWTEKENDALFPENVGNFEETLKNETDISIQKSILINAETGDIERKRAKEVLERLEHTIRKLRDDYKDINIIFNEITVDWNK